MVTDPPDIKKDLCNYLRIIDSDKSTASVLDDHKQNLDKVLARWSKQVREIESHSDHVYEKLVYVLEHEYSEANMGLEHFRGKDQLRARYLLEACQDQGFCLYFAQFESSVYGEVEGDFDCEWEADCHDYIHEIESELELGTIFQYNGKRIAEKIDLETEDLLENVDFTCFEPDEERFDGYYGEGYTATHSYFRTCAVIVHRIRRYDFLLHAETTHVQEYVEMLLREMQDGSLSVALQDELKRFCALVIDRWTVHKQHSIFEVARVPDKELESIGKATLRLDCPDLLEKLVIGTSSPVPLDLFQELGRGLVERDVSLWHYG